LTNLIIKNNYKNIKMIQNNEEELKMINYKKRVLQELYIRFIIQKTMFCLELEESNNNLIIDRLIR
jgi:hypothetical protein